MWIKENCGYIANSEESAGTKWFYYNCKEGTKVLRCLAGYVPKSCSRMKQSNQCSVKYTKELPSRTGLFMVLTPTSYNQKSLIVKIGRASCRERV